MRTKDARWDGVRRRRESISSRGARALERARSYATTISPEQWRLIERWRTDEPSAADDKGRLRRDRRAGVVTGPLITLFILLILGIIFLAWLRYISHGVLP